MLKICDSNRFTKSISLSVKCLKKVENLKWATSYNQELITTTKNKSGNFDGQQQQQQDFLKKADHLITCPKIC
jgi:hypothetical protein